MCNYSSGSLALSYEMGGGLFVGFDYDATRRRHIWGVFSFSITVRLPCLQLAMLTYKAGPFNSDDHGYTCDLCTEKTV